MSKFKVGQEVEFVSSSHHKYKKGDVITVARVDSDGFYCKSGQYSMDRRAKLVESEEVVIPKWSAKEVVFIKVGNDRNVMDEAQKLLFARGCKWMSGDQEFRYYSGRYIKVDTNGFFSMSDYGSSEGNTVDLTFLITIEKPVRVEVSVDGEESSVGTDTAEAIKNLIKEDQGV